MSVSENVDYLKLDWIFNECVINTVTFSIVTMQLSNLVMCTFKY